MLPTRVVKLGCLILVKTPVIKIVGANVHLIDTCVAMVNVVHTPFLRRPVSIGIRVPLAAIRVPLIVVIPG